MREWDQKDNVSILLGKSFWSCDIIETPGIPGPQSENHCFSCYAVEIRTLSICSVRLPLCNPWSSCYLKFLCHDDGSSSGSPIHTTKVQRQQNSLPVLMKKRERPIPCPNCQHPLPWESVSSTCNLLPPLNSFPHRTPRTFFSFRKSDHVTLSS